MHRLRLLALTFVAVVAVSLGMQALAQNAPGGDPSQSGGGQGGGQGGGPGGGGGGRPPAGYHLIPPFVMNKLNLTDDQKQQVDQLEKDTKAKLATILTADQMKTLETAHPPRRGGGQNGQQGGPGGDQGGGPGGGAPGGDQGPPN